MTNALIFIGILAAIASGMVFLDWFSRRKDRRAPHRKA